MDKDLLQKNRNHPYSAPVVTVVEFRMERGFLFSLSSDIESRARGYDLWGFAPGTMNEERDMSSVWDHTPGGTNETRHFGDNVWDN